MVQSEQSPLALSCTTFATSGSNGHQENKCKADIQRISTVLHLMAIEEMNGYEARLEKGKPLRKKKKENQSGTVLTR